MIIAQFHATFSPQEFKWSDRIKEEGKRRKAAMWISASCPPYGLSVSLKSETQSQTNCPAIVDALIRIALYEPPEVWVEIDTRNRQ